MSDTIQLIVGLGNPGPQYEHTRHNVGAWLVNQIAKQYHATLRKESKFLGEYAKVVVDHQDCHLLFPTTYMNNSGQSVVSVAKFFKIPPEAILVAHDDLDLTLGTIKFKTGGGHGGHNGLRDIIAHLGGNNNFKRIRIGISHPGHSDKVLNHVLGQVNKSEAEEINAGINQVLELLPTIVKGDFQQAMQSLHTKQV